MIKLIIQVNINSMDNFKTKYTHQKIQWQFWSHELIKTAKKPFILYITHFTSRNSRIFDEYYFQDSSIVEKINSHFIPLIINKYEQPEISNYFNSLSQELWDTSTDPILVITDENLIPIKSLALEDFSKTSENDFLNLLDFTQSSDAKDKTKKAIDNISKHPKVQENKRIAFPGEFPAPQAVVENFLEVINKDLENKENSFFNLAFYEWFIEQTMEGMIEKKAAEGVLQKLEFVLSSAMVDHVRGGTFHYCFDSTWSIPQFEKVLTRQSAYLRVLAKFSVLAPSPIIFDSILNTMDYLENEMLHEDLYFMNAQHSMSENMEGVFHTFTEQEFEDAIIKSDESLNERMDQIKSWFKITSQGDLSNQLNCIRFDLDHAKEFLTPENWDVVRKVRDALLSERNQRIPPQSDNNSQASWNFDLISSLCDVIQYSNIKIIKDRATGIINKVIDSIHTNFFSRSKEKTATLNHCPNFQNESPYFQDYVAFIDAHTRLYEVTGRSKFKENALMSIEYVMKEFFDGSYFLEKKVNSNFPINNLHSTLFDHSFRSSTARFLGILRKWELLEASHANDEKVKKIIDDVKQFSLHSPLYFGEALRAVTYPDQAYKLIEVPKAWIKNNDFIALKAYLSYRFLIHYNDTQNQWSVSDKVKLESEGEGYEEFKKFLMGPAEEAKA